MLVVNERLWRIVVPPPSFSLVTLDGALLKLLGDAGVLVDVRVVMCDGPCRGSWR